MILNDVELATTEERIRHFQSLLAQFRISARPEEFPAMASGYRAEIDAKRRPVVLPVKESSIQDGCSAVLPGPPNSPVSQ